MAEKAACGSGTRCRSGARIWVQELALEIMLAKHNSGGGWRAAARRSAASCRRLAICGEQRWFARLYRLRLFRAAAALCGRQLQHCCGLAGHEAGHQHDLAARELQSIVMDMRVVHIDLAEAGYAMADARSAEHTESAVELDVVVESDLRPGEQADRHIRLTDFGKAPRDRLYEIGGNEPVRDLGWPRGDEMQTVVAHGNALLSRAAPYGSSS